MPKIYQPTYWRDGERITYRHWYARLPGPNGRYQKIKLTTSREGSELLLAEIIKGRETQGRVYFIRSGEFVKIGFTQNLKHRVHTLQNGSPMKVELLHHFSGTEAEERMYQAKFDKDRLRNQHEWFRLSPEILAFIEASRKPQNRKEPRPRREKESRPRRKPVAGFSQTAGLSAGLLY